MKFTNKDGELRLYDGAATPNFLTVFFSGGDFSGPLGAPRVEEVLVLDRQRLDERSHYIEGSDAALLEPAELSFSALLHDAETCGFLLDWLSGGPVNGHGLTTTKGTTRRNGTVLNPGFADPGKMAFDLEFRLDGAASQVWRYAEVYFPLSECRIQESTEGVLVSLRGRCYGTIGRSDAFRDGLDTAL